MSVCELDGKILDIKSMSLDYKKTYLAARTIAFLKF